MLEGFNCKENYIKSNVFATFFLIVQKKQMFTGAYIRSAEFENGGTYQVRYISICSEYTVNNYIYCVLLFAIFAAAIIH
jgi:hypothetical protein